MSEQAILYEVHARVDDPRWQGLFAWRDARPGRRIVASLAPRFPEELAEALGMLHVSLLDKYTKLRPGCGSPPPFDALVLDGSCDQARRNSSFVVACRPGVSLYVLRPGPAAGSSCVRQIVDVAGFLEELGDVRLTPERLLTAAAAVARRRRRMRDLMEQRVHDPSALSLADIHALFRLAWRMPAAEHTQLLERLLVQLRRRPRPAAPPMSAEHRTPKVCLIGVCGLPPLGLLEQIEEAGLRVVDGYVPPLPASPAPQAEGSSPLARLATLYGRSLVEHGHCLAGGPSILRWMRGRGAAAVIILRPLACRLGCAHLEQLRAWLAERGSPSLIVTYDPVERLSPSDERRLGQLALDLRFRRTGADLGPASVA